MCYNCRYETKLQVQKRGVCSAYLASIADAAAAAGAGPAAGAAPPRLLPIWLSDGSLKPPADPRVPMILVGPGTGIAPFRSFLEDRQQQRKQAAAQSQGQAPHGDVQLFFGCRNQAADFYFAEQWETMLSDGTLTGLHTAFSRDGASKVYVQQRIKDAGAVLWPLLVGDGEERPPAMVYVAGNAVRARASSSPCLCVCVCVCSAPLVPPRLTDSVRAFACWLCLQTNMPAAVRRAFVSVVMTHGGLADAAAESFVRAMEKARRYQTETWA